MSESAELEFLNDAIYFSRAGQEFEWLIAKQLDISSAQKRMKELLGNGDIPDGLDSKLKSYLTKLRSQNADLADEMESGLEDLFQLIESGQVIKKAEYVD